MDLEDPRDTSRDRRNTRGLYAWLLDVLKSPWLAVCLMGLLLLVRSNKLTFYHSVLHVFATCIICCQ